MIAAMFDCADRLFGLRFVEKTGLDLYHSDVRLWEVRNRDDAPVGDMALHSLPNGTPVDIAQCEAQQRELLGVPEDIGLRHHLPHFGHLFSGGYAAGYYVYMWAEVLEADAFTEAGDPFHAETAERLHRHVYSAGGKRKPAEAYRAFRGRDAIVKAMLRKRGLVGDS